ncbi:hypothetical protein ACQLRR_004192 [Escherichia coli]|uniref:hypothetical protein n=1 Tax=Escherichia coli TaxID=562 RepID=UPI0017953E62|nr:hypothetical protein [Escherichia coli]EFG9986426.1 hypothetical protein [Escherichia coli]MCN5251159.1 hypothetical protein [Escherichia coli]MCN9011269.1 hypothetical protein [Escherichia coli]
MNINKQAYHADGGDISTGRLKEIADNVYGDEEKCWLAKRVLALADEIAQLRRLVIRVPMPIMMPKEMIHQLYNTETKRCRTCNDGLRGGCSSCMFYKQ